MKKYIIGFIAGALLMISVPTIAKGINEVVKVTIRHDYSVKLNGSEVSLTKSPLIYDGTSYLPLKEVASLLGVDTIFNSGVIEISKKGDAASSENLLNLGVSPEDYHKMILDRIQLSEHMILTQQNFVELYKDDEEKRKYYENDIQTHKDNLAQAQHEMDELLKKYPELN